MRHALLSFSRSSHATSACACPAWNTALLCSSNAIMRSWSIVTALTPKIVAFFAARSRCLRAALCTHVQINGICMLNCMEVLTGIAASPDVACSEVCRRCKARALHRTACCHTVRCPLHACTAWPVWHGVPSRRLLVPQQAASGVGRQDPTLNPGHVFRRGAYLALGVLQQLMELILFP